MNRENPRVYAAKHKNEAERMRSQSGGMFAVLSDRTLKQGGVVYGCVLNERFEAVHTSADTAEGRERMRGSKYVQSAMGDVYQQVKQDLEQGREVLYTGTSCQVAGLRSFLGKDYPNLLTADIICHGVSTPLMLKEYLAWQQSRNKGQLTAFNFRNKKDFGWEKCIETLSFADHPQVNSDVYKRLFFSHCFTRPSCFRCPYKQIMHPGDITIGDYWGIEKAAPDFKDNKGVSLVLINSEKGDMAFEAVKNNLELRETRIEDSMQHPLVGPYDPPKNRRQGMKDLQTLPFEKVAVKYGGHGLKNSLKRRIKKLLK